MTLLLFAIACAPSSPAPADDGGARTSAMAPQPTGAMPPDTGVPTPPAGTTPTAATGAPRVDTGPPPCADTLAGAVNPLVPDTPVDLDAGSEHLLELTVPAFTRTELVTEPLDVDIAVVDDAGVVLRTPRAWMTLANTSEAEVTYRLALSHDLPDTCLTYTVAATESPAGPCSGDAVGDDWTEAGVLMRYPNTDTWFGLDPIHTGDEDWYRLEIPQGTRPTVEVWGVDQGVVAEVYADPEGTPLLSHDGSYSYDYFDLTSFVPVPEGTYYLRLAESGGYAVCPNVWVYVRG